MTRGVVGKAEDTYSVPTHVWLPNLNFVFTVLDPTSGFVKIIRLLSGVPKTALTH